MLNFDNFAEATSYFARKLASVKSYSRDKVGTGDGYKKEIFELNNISYSVPATRIVVEKGPHKAFTFWVIGEILTEFFGMNPPLMTKYKRDVIEQSYKLKLDGRVEYCYGERWAEHSQIMNLIKILSVRPESKRAVLATYTPYDADISRQDVPCTLIHQFLMRDGKMSVTTYFRSHDFASGHKYDVYLSSFLCQFMAMAVNASTGSKIVPGKLFFFDGSLHLYSKDFELLKTAVNTESSYRVFDIMHNYNSLNELFNDLTLVKEVEELSYWGKFTVAALKVKSIKNPAFRDFARVYMNKNGCKEGVSKLPYETAYFGHSNHNGGV